jgi:DNA helicase-2/ATP-dependent DNA helicase PcrA
MGETCRAELSPEERQIVDEEEAMLERARAALAQATQAAAQKRVGSELRSVDALRELRDEAASAKADDLPPLLLEMSVRQRLMERGGPDPLPDPLLPYLAHLKVREGGKSKDYLLGRVSFLDPATGVRIVDWRVAPIAQIFYRYREGETYEEEFPGRVAEGVVLARRIVVIANGSIAQIVGDRVVLQRARDGAWSSSRRGALAFAPGGTGTAARPGELGIGIGGGDRATADVTALLDPEQFAAINAPPEQPLLVLGSAGSGKTTVALHRLARLAATAPRQYPLARMSIVVPHEGLARLSQRLTDPLGVGATQIRTLDAWALDLAVPLFTKQRPRICMDPPSLVSSLKRHPALYDALRERFADLAPSRTSLPKLRRLLAEAFTDRTFLTGVAAASAGTLPKSAVEECVRHTLLQLAEPAEKQLRSIVVADMKKTVDGRAVWEGTPDELAGTIDIEDLPILLTLRAWRGEVPPAQVAHLVLDEAEDFSLFELYLLGKSLDLPRSVTLAGDEAQQTSASFPGWDRGLSTLDVGDAVTCRLSVSYRCPRPIAEIARAILGPLAPESPARAAREGVPVGTFRFPTEAHAHIFLAGALADLVAREPLASVGVLSHEPETARRFYELLRERPEARLVERGEFSFEPGIDVTDVESAKGLEFDYVIVPDATEGAYPSTDEARRRLHVAVTRASHQLWLLGGGSPSPLVTFGAS